MSDNFFKVSSATHVRQKESITHVSDAAVKGINMYELKMPELSFGTPQHDFDVSISLPYEGNIAIPVLTGTVDLDDITGKVPYTDSPKFGYTEEVIKALNGPLTSFIGNTCDNIFKYMSAKNKTADFCNIVLSTTNNVDDAIVFPYSGRINSFVHVQGLLKWLKLDATQGFEVFATANEVAPRISCIIKVEIPDDKIMDTASRKIVLMCSVSSPCPVEVDVEKLTKDGEFEISKGASTFNMRSLYTCLDPDARAFLFDNKLLEYASFIGIAVAIDSDIEFLRVPTDIKIDTVSFKPETRKAIEELKTPETVVKVEEEKEKETAKNEKDVEKKAGTGAEGKKEPKKVRKMKGE